MRDIYANENEEGMLSMTRQYIFGYIYHLDEIDGDGYFPESLLDGIIDRRWEIRRGEPTSSGEESRKGEDGVLLSSLSKLSLYGLSIGNFMDKLRVFGLMQVLAKATC